MTVAVRVFAFSVLPLLLAALYARLSPEVQGRLGKIEVYLIYMFFLGVGASGLSGFFGHVFTPDVVAESIDWAKGSPFQQEMGFANLAVGILGFVSAGRRDGFREATVLAVAVLGVGTSVVHVIDIVESSNLAPGNSVQIVGNLLKPALLIPLLLMSRAAEVAGGGGPAFDQWRMSVIGTAGMATGVVGVGFGIGFALDMPVMVTSVAALLAALFTAWTTSGSFGARRNRPPGGRATSS